MVNLINLCLRPADMKPKKKKINSKTSKCTARWMGIDLLRRKGEGKRDAMMLHCTKDQGVILHNTRQEMCLRQESALAVVVSFELWDDNA